MSSVISVSQFLHFCISISVFVFLLDMLCVPTLVCRMKRSACGSGRTISMMMTYVSTHVSLTSHVYADCSRLRVSTFLTFPRHRELFICIHVERTHHPNPHTLSSLYLRLSIFIIPLLLFVYMTNKEKEEHVSSSQTRYCATCVQGVNSSSRLCPYCRFAAFAPRFPFLSLATSCSSPAPTAHSVPQHRSTTHIPFGATAASAGSALRLAC